MSQLGGVDTHQTLRLSFQPMWQQPSGMWMNICGKPLDRGVEWNCYVRGNARADHIRGLERKLIVCE